MDTEKLFNPLKEFDFTVLNEQTFGEDSVREEIITPILKALGYSASGTNKIVRSPKLQHPFVSIGSARHKVSLIPDYLMKVNQRNAWILEAKAPNESIIKTAHVEQAYGYAVHSEILAKHFVLCNGKEFALYSIGEQKLLQLHFSIYELPIYWSSIKRILSPETIFTHTNKFSKDLGLHLERLDIFSQFETIIFPKVFVPFIAQLNSDLFTFVCNTFAGGEEYCASFDFNLSTAKQLAGKIDINAYDILLQPYINGVQKRVIFNEQNIFLNVETILGKKLEENSKELFRPIVIKRFLD